MTSTSTMVHGFLAITAICLAASCALVPHPLPWVKIATITGGLAYGAFALFKPEPGDSNGCGAEPNLPTRKIIALIAVVGLALIAKYGIEGCAPSTPDVGYYTLAVIVTAEALKFLIEAALYYKKVQDASPLTALRSIGSTGSGAVSLMGQTPISRRNSLHQVLTARDGTTAV